MKEPKEWLLTLDERRHLDPQGVRSELLEGLSAVPDAQMPLWCGILGSCLRMMGKYKEAREILLAGLGQADKHLDHRVAGDLHQRLSMVYLYMADFPEALTQNSMAITRHLEGGSVQGRAKSFVDRGSILGPMGQFKWSNECYARALSLLSEDEKRHRCSAHMGYAVNLLRLEEVSEATEHLEQAATLDPPDPVFLGKLFWAVSKANGSERALLQAIDLLEKTSPADSLMASIDLLRFRLDLDDEDGAHAAAADLSRLAGLLRHDRRAQLVAIELANLGLRGEGLTRAAIATAAARVSYLHSDQDPGQADPTRGGIGTEGQIQG